MGTAVAYVIPFVALFFLFGGLASLVLILKRLQINRLWKKRRRTPTSAELRRRRIPVIESTPFWVPGIPGDIVGIEIQPSAHSTVMPITYSTPKPRRYKVNRDQLPQLKFSVQYHKARCIKDDKNSGVNLAMDCYPIQKGSGVLEVQLLDTANISVESLSDDEEFHGEDSSVFLFANVFLTPQEQSKKRLRLMSRRRRRRHKSFEIEMSYETLQLQTLQFCVMGYDEYSRQKVIGDVLLPLAELAQQGIDITKELVMWRDIQTSQPRSQSLREKMGHMSSIGPSVSQDDCGPKCTGKPAESKCSTS